MKAVVTSSHFGKQLFIRITQNFYQKVRGIEDLDYIFSICSTGDYAYIDMHTNITYLHRPT